MFEQVAAVEAALVGIPETAVLSCCPEFCVVSTDASDKFAGITARLRTINRHPKQMLKAHLNTGYYIIVPIK